MAALALLLLVGGQVREVPCAGTVGAGARSAACEAEIAAANAAIFSDHTLPLLVWITLGYLVFGCVAVLLARRRRAIGRQEDRDGVGQRVPSKPAEVVERQTREL